MTFSRGGPQSSKRVPQPEPEGQLILAGLTRLLHRRLENW